MSKKAARGASERPEESSPSMHGRLSLASSKLSRAEASSGDVAAHVGKHLRSSSASSAESIYLSRSSLGLRPRAQVSAAAREAIGEELVEAVTRRSRELYRDGQASLLLRSASRSRKVVALQVEPYVSEVNAALRASHIRYYFTVESEYASSLSVHPRYYLAVRHV